MSIEIIALDNSYVINGTQVEKGRLTITVDSGHVCVNNLSANLSDVSINGNTYNSDDSFREACDSLLFSEGGGAPSEGVQSVTGDGVNNSDPKNPVLTQVTWATISGKPVFIASGANAAAARTSLGLGTAATTASTAYATAAQGVLASSALQDSDTSMFPEAGKIPIFSPQGLLSTGTPQFPENAVPLSYFDVSTKPTVVNLNSASQYNVIAGMNNQVIVTLASNATGSPTVQLPAVITGNAGMEITLINLSSTQSITFKSNGSEEIIYLDSGAAGLSTTSIEPQTTYVFLCTGQVLISY